MLTSRTTQDGTLASTHGFGNDVAAGGVGHAGGELKQVVEAAAEGGGRGRRGERVGHRGGDEVLPHLREENTTSERGDHHNV